MLTLIQSHCFLMSIYSGKRYLVGALTYNVGFLVSIYKLSIAYCFPERFYCPLQSDSIKVLLSWKSYNKIMQILAIFHFHAHISILYFIKTGVYNKGDLMYRVASFARWVKTLCRNIKCKRINYRAPQSGTSIKHSVVAGNARTIVHWGTYLF